MMPPQAFDNPHCRLIEFGVDQYRQVLPKVLKHLDSATVASISDSIASSIELQGMRFAAFQAFLVASSVDTPSLLELGPDVSMGELASAYLLEYPGKLASLVGPWVPVDQSTRHSNAAAPVLDALIRCARNWGVEIVQAVIEADSPFSTEELRCAGLRRLSTLYQMAIDFPVTHDFQRSDWESDEKRIDVARSVSLEWKRYDPEDEGIWVEWMDSTYEQTADCPELNGLRTTSETLLGYFAASGAGSGEKFGPEWWAVFEGDRRSGSLGEPGARIISAFMLSDWGSGFWELSYMGVVPEFRGRGLGEATLRSALMRARKLNARRLTLAVDCRNSYAIRIYESHGFHRLRQLEAWFLALTD
jgi:ribosomal protein S18 acetylase RimI-like enzyme